MIVVLVCFICSCCDVFKNMVTEHFKRTENTEENMKIVDRYANAISFEPNKDVVFLLFKLLLKLPSPATDASPSLGAYKKNKYSLLFSSIAPVPRGKNANFEDVMFFMQRMMRSSSLLLDLVKTYCLGFQNSQLENFNEKMNPNDFLQLLSVVSSSNSKYSNKEKNEINERIDLLEKALVEASRNKLSNFSGLFAEGIAYILIPMILHKGKREVFLQTIIPEKLLLSLQRISFVAQSPTNKNNSIEFQHFKTKSENLMLKHTNINLKNSLTVMKDCTKNCKAHISCSENDAFKVKSSDFSTQESAHFVTRSITQLESSYFNGVPENLLFSESQEFLLCYNYLCDLQKGLIYLNENLNQTVKRSHAGPILVEQRNLVQDLIRSCHFFEIKDNCIFKQDVPTLDNSFESAERLVPYAGEEDPQKASASASHEERKTNVYKDDVTIPNVDVFNQISFSKLNTAAGEAEKKEQDAGNVFAELTLMDHSETEFNSIKGRTNLVPKKDNLHMKFDLLGNSSDAFLRNEKLDKAQQNSPSGSSDSEDVFFSYSSTADLLKPKDNNKAKSGDLGNALKVGSNSKKAKCKNKPSSKPTVFLSPTSNLFGPPSQCHTNLLPPVPLIAGPPLLAPLQQNSNFKPLKRKSGGQFPLMDSALKNTQSVKFAKNFKVNYSNKNCLTTFRSKSAGAFDFLSSSKKNRDKYFYNSEFSASDETLDGNENALYSSTKDQPVVNKELFKTKHAKLDINQTWLPITNHPLYAGSISGGHSWWIRSGKNLSYEDQIKYIGDLHMIIDGLKYETFYLKGCMNINE